MHCIPWKRRLTAACFTMALAVLAPNAFAEDVASDRESVLFEARIYQVLTNVSGNGLTSHTLAGMNGWLQVIHQRLDDVELVMEGETLTWNGQPAPDHPRIIRIATPLLKTFKGVAAELTVGPELGPAQYMVRKESNLFEMKADPENVAGLTLRLTPGAVHQENGLLDCDLSFRYSWVKEREKIDGVNLEVGRPVMGRVTAEGPVQMRLGQWSCYQAPVNSEGLIYLFLRAEVTDQKGLQERGGQSKRGNDAANETDGNRDGNRADAAPRGGGPKIEVGGSVRVRGTYTTGPQP